jgi:hypothetical protein
VRISAASHQSFPIGASTNCTAAVKSAAIALHALLDGVISSLLVIAE